LTLDRESLSRLLLVEWPQAMRIPRVIAFLKSSESTLSFLGTSDELGHNLIDLQMPAEGRLSVYLQNTLAPIPDGQLKFSLSQFSLNIEEASLLSLSEISYWLPLISGGKLQGLLLIGRRPEDDPFSAEDERILATMAHQAGIAAHNVYLAEEIRLARSELTRAHQQLLVERDQNQQRLALELHDEGIQELMGILFQVSEMQRDLNRMSKERGQNPVGKRLGETLLSVQDQIKSLISYLRSLTYELYPPGLEEMGLTLALESYINHIKRQDNLAPQFLKIDMDKISSADIPLPIAMSIFRAAQEALRNALNHAQAKNITLRLRRSPPSITLSIVDDGCGFRVPARLSQLARSGHFGLVGMAERVAWAGGELVIHSDFGAGTEVSVCVPCKSSDSQSEGLQ
jgi:signal transduction histidine kinase